MTLTTRSGLVSIACTLALVCGWAVQASGQTPTRGFSAVIDALREAPGCLGVETGQTSSGRRVIFAWFESKRALVDWYHGDVHQRAMRRLYPDVPFDRQPLPDLPENSGPILTIVSVKLDETSSSIASIGIKLYGPLPGGIAVGGRFAPSALKVPGLRELPTSVSGH